MRVLRRVLFVALALSAWFLTLTDGWEDIHRAMAGDLLPPSGPPRGLLVRGVTLTNDAGLGMPTRLVVSGAELLVLDRYRSEPILALNRHSGRLLRSFGSEGDGPGEFRSPVALVANESGVAVLDVGLNRITWLTSTPDRFALLTTTQLELDWAATDVVLAPGGGYLVSGFVTDGRLAQVDRRGSLREYGGREVTVDGLPRARQIEVLQRTLRASPTGDRLVRTSRFASYIEVVDAETLATTVIWGPDRFGPEGGRYETRFGYLDAAPFSDGFFALYSGRTRQEYPGRANYGSLIHEFGWDGRLKAEYQLDADAIAIAWSQEDRLLYAVRHEPVPSVMAYGVDR